MKTTLNQIRSQKPCEDGWKKLLTYLGKTKADDAPLTILSVLESNGLEDAIWCLHQGGQDADLKAYAAWAAAQVRDLLTNPKSLCAVAQGKARSISKILPESASWRMSADAWYAAATGDTAWVEPVASWFASGEAQRDAQWDPVWVAAWSIRLTIWVAALVATQDVEKADPWAGAWSGAADSQRRKLIEICTQGEK